MKEGQIFFQCGRFADISQGEIASRFPESFAKHLSSSNILVANLNPSLSFVPESSKQDIQNIFDGLGSVIRMGSVLAESHATDDIISVCAEIIEKKGKASGKKVRFGVSVFCEHTPHNFLKTILIGIKKECQKRGISIRFVNRNFQNLDAGTYHKEKLSREENTEFCLFREGDIFLITETLAAQDVEAFAKRDFGKPVRDMQVGMLPPKLALIMVNLSRDKEGNLPKKIWDPFCGTGSILIEAARLGITCFGSDISLQMVEAARTNMKHFFSEFDVQNITEHDATRPMSGKIDSHAIVTEGYLGPIFSKSILESEFQKLEAEVMPIYHGFFKHCSADTVIISFPFWKKKSGGYAHLQKVLESTKCFGYIASAFQHGTERGSLEFMRNNQTVGREIFRFHRT